ncbi:hypothetical protein EVAR_33286_1 [Eumeta japonica]|uniref:Uncharacterized protein n=1 Tax=Eumeta variegata TaxID=151549 RepID=A0A4C1WEY1_EUMVA|nr:hypothetical protein EVAR_33286_1 [Eumeta japonica]
MWTALQDAHLFLKGDVVMFYLVNTANEMVEAGSEEKRDRPGAAGRRGETTQYALYIANMSGSVAQQNPYLLQARRKELRSNKSRGLMPAVPGVIHQSALAVRRARVALRQ